MAALAAAISHQRPVDRRFRNAASELPTPPPPPLLAHSRFLARVATRPAGGSRRQPSAITGPWTAASRSQPPSCRRCRNRRHFSQRCFVIGLLWLASPPVWHGGSGRRPLQPYPWPVDRRFLIAASAPTPPQPPPLLAAVLRSRVLALLGSRHRPSCRWLSSQPSAAARGPPLPDRSLRAAGGSGRQPSATAARGPPLPDRSL